MERPCSILDTAPDERLVALAAAGDERAFAAIVARYRVPLRRYCRRFLGPASADDARAADASSTPTRRWSAGRRRSR